MYMQEHLTKQNKLLLNETKTVFKAMNFEYPGYVKDGQVRVKQFKNDKPRAVKCLADIKKIKDEYEA